MSKDNKQRISDLNEYKQMLENRISSPIPDKHKDHPESFKAYLNNELRLVKLKLDKLDVQ